MRDRVRPSSGRPATRRCGAPISAAGASASACPSTAPGYGCVPGTRGETEVPSGAPGTVTPDTLGATTASTPARPSR